MDPNARARYALDVLGRLIGTDLHDAQLDLPTTPGDWDDPNPSVEVRDGLPVLYPRDGEPGDLLYASYALLTAPWERVDPADEVGCPLAPAGWPARNGVLREPLVHRYAGRVAELVGVDVPRRPSFVVTHDVDDNFRHLFERRESWTRLKRELRAWKPSAVRRGAGLARRIARHMDTDPNDRFDTWRSWHEGRGSTPAYFVAARGVFDRTSDERDVAYDIRHPSVQRTLREAAGEIGVHFSINARSSAEHLRSEREELEQVLGSPVRSARHHWWALGPAEETWARQAEAGVALDCSLGYNDGIGYRRGIAAAFRPYDPRTQRAADFWVLPTLAMDVAALGLDDPREELIDLVARTAAVGGALVLDWHVHAANPKALPGALELLDDVADAADVAGLEPKTPLGLVAGSPS